VACGPCGVQNVFFFFFFTLVTGPRRSLSPKLGDTRVYEPQIRSERLRQQQLRLGCGVKRETGDEGTWVDVLGFRVKGFGFRVSGPGFRV